MVEYGAYINRDWLAINVMFACFHS